QRLDELIAAARRYGDLPAPFGGEAMLALILQLRAGSEASSGSITRAHAWADEALQVARQRRLVESEGWACNCLASLEWIDGDVDRALPRVRRALEVAEQIGSAFSIAWGLDSLATVLAHAGYADSLALAERCVAVSRENNTCLEGEASHLAVLSA